MLLELFTFTLYQELLLINAYPWQSFNPSMYVINYVRYVNNAYSFNFELKLSQDLLDTFSNQVLKGHNHYFKGVRVRKNITYPTFASEQLSKRQEDKFKNFINTEKTRLESIVSILDTLHTIVRPLVYKPLVCSINNPFFLDNKNVILQYSKSKTGITEAINSLALFQNELGEQFCESRN